MKKRKQITKRICLAGLMAAAILTAVSCAAPSGTDSSSTTTLTDAVSPGTISHPSTVPSSTAAPSAAVSPETAAPFGSGESGTETTEYNTVLMKEAKSICGTYFKKRGYVL